MPKPQNVMKFVFRFRELKYTGTIIYCVGIIVSAMSKVLAKKTNSRVQVPSGSFLYDLIFTFSVCGIPLSIVENKHFQSFWQHYIPKCPLPTKLNMMRNVRYVKDVLDNNIRNELRGKPLWLTVFETTGAQSNTIVNVLVRVLRSDQPSKPYLIVSKIPERNNAAAIEQFVLTALKKFKIRKHNVLMFVTIGTEHMLKAGALLKKQCCNLIHVTCLLHSCQLVVESIASSYPEVDKFMKTTNMFLMDERMRGKRMKIPEPPQLVLTRSGGTWLQACFYYNEHIETVKHIISKFDSDNLGFINYRQQFDNPEVKSDLSIICKKYEFLLNVIDKLKNSSLSLLESLEVVHDLNVALQALTDTPGIRAAETFKSVLSQSPDYAKMCSIGERLRHELASEFEQNFRYANITFADVEKSFRKYSATTSISRIRVANIVEGVLMMHMYADIHKSSLLETN